MRITHDHRITGALDGRPLDADAMLVALGLGRYFGGGMMITPGASPQSGHFHVVLAQKLSRLELLGLLPGLYCGRHLDHPRITAAYAGHIKIEADRIHKPNLFWLTGSQQFTLAVAPSTVRL